MSGRFQTRMSESNKDLLINMVLHSQLQCTSRMQDVQNLFQLRSGPP